MAYSMSIAMKTQTKHCSTIKRATVVSYQHNMLINWTPIWSWMATKHSILNKEKLHVGTRLTFCFLHEYLITQCRSTAEEVMWWAERFEWNPTQELGTCSANGLVVHTKVRLILKCAGWESACVSPRNLTTSTCNVYQVVMLTWGILCELSQKRNHQRARINCSQAGPIKDHCGGEVSRGQPVRHYVCVWGSFQPLLKVLPWCSRTLWTDI